MENKKIIGNIVIFIGAAIFLFQLCMPFICVGEDGLVDMSMMPLAVRILSFSWLLFAAVGKALKDDKADVDVE